MARSEISIPPKSWPDFVRKAHAGTKSIGSNESKGEGNEG